MLLATSLMIGALVAVAGPIGFVGLIVPHMLRRFVGHDHLFLVPACILGGGAFLTLCDAGARTALGPPSCRWASSPRSSAGRSSSGCWCGGGKRHLEAST